MVENNNIALTENLYLEHKDHIYNYIHRMCNDPQLSQDVVQTTFIKLMTDSIIENVEHQKAYLFTIARNTLFDEMKRKKPVYFDDQEKLQEIAEVDDDTSLQQATEDEVIASVIDKAIYNMPEKFRELMLLRYTEDLSIQEIADITGRKLSDIKVNLHRARLSFETRFSATMYSRIALSRQRCETLKNMIASFGDGDIPADDIPTIELHIADCTNCNEDATQMKKRRELFALVPILVASGLWEDIMKEAQASTLSSAQNANKTATQSNPTKTIHSTTKLSSVKIGSIAAVTAAIVVTGFIITYHLKKDESSELIAPIANKDGPTSVTPPPATPVATEKSTITATTTTPTTITSPPTTTPNAPASRLVDTQPKSEPKQQLTQTDSIKPSVDDTSNDSWFYKGPPLKAIEEEIFDSETTIYTVYLSPYGSRSEEAGGPNGSAISISNFVKRKGWVVYPELKVYLDMKLDKEGNSSILPAPERTNKMTNLYEITPCSNFDVSVKLGMDTVAGQSVEKWGCEESRTKQRTIQWYDPIIKLVIAEENNEIGKNIVKEFTLQNIDKSLFELPKGYKEVSLNEFMQLTQSQN